MSGTVDTTTTVWTTQTHSEEPIKPFNTRWYLALELSVITALRPTNVFPLLQCDRTLAGISNLPSNADVHQCLEECLISRIKSMLLRFGRSRLINAFRINLFGCKDPCYCVRRTFVAHRGSILQRRIRDGPFGPEVSRSILQRRIRDGPFGTEVSRSNVAKFPAFVKFFLRHLGHIDTKFIEEVMQVKWMHLVRNIYPKSHLFRILWEFAPISEVHGYLRLMLSVNRKFPRGYWKRIFEEGVFPKWLAWSEMDSALKSSLIKYRLICTPDEQELHNLRETFGGVTSAMACVVLHGCTTTKYGNLMCQWNSDTLHSPSQPQLLFDVDFMVNALSFDRNGIRFEYLKRVLSPIVEIYGMNSILEMIHRRARSLRVAGNEHDSSHRKNAVDLANQLNRVSFNACSADEIVVLRLVLIHFMVKFCPGLSIMGILKIYLPLMHSATRILVKHCKRSTYGMNTGGDTVLTIYETCVIEIIQDVMPALAQLYWVQTINLDHVELTIAHIMSQFYKLCITNPTMFGSTFPATMLSLAIAVKDLPVCCSMIRGYDVKMPHRMLEKIIPNAIILRQIMCHHYITCDSTSPNKMEFVHISCDNAWDMIRFHMSNINDKYTRGSIMMSMVRAVATVSPVITEDDWFVDFRDLLEHAIVKYKCKPDVWTISRLMYRNPIIDPHLRDAFSVIAMGKVVYSHMVSHCVVCIRQDTTLKFLLDTFINEPKHILTKHSNDSMSNTDRNFACSLTRLGSHMNYRTI